MDRRQHYNNNDGKNVMKIKRKNHIYYQEAN